MFEFIIVVILLVFLISIVSREQFTNKSNPLIVLYDPSPLVLATDSYNNNIFPFSLTSFKISIPKQNDTLDDKRFIDLYSVYPNNPIASSYSKTASVDQYTLADQSNYIAYTPKYKKIVSVKAGQSITADVNFPVKAIMINSYL